jgi:hypothetical protein
MTNSIEHIITRKTILALSNNIEGTFYKECPGYDEIIFSDTIEKPTKEIFHEMRSKIAFDEYMKQLREERSTRLAKVDWVVIRAFSMNTPVTDEWKTYMQTLRDLPSTTEDPSNPVWPVRPDQSP